MSIDERRRMFRLNRWKEMQISIQSVHDPATETAQDIRQVWFAGVHGDAGRLSGSRKAAFRNSRCYDPAGLQHMLRMDQTMIDHLVWGEPRLTSNHNYVPPDAMG